MSPADLLAELGRRGLELRAEGAHLRYRGPRGALDATLREALRAHKAALLHLLTTCPRHSAPRPPAGPLDAALVHAGPPCFRCTSTARWRTRYVEGCWACRPPRHGAALLGSDGRSTSWDRLDEQACYACGSRDRWRTRHGTVVCRRCHPPAPGAEAS